jgi:hypothetical protein
MLLPVKGHNRKKEKLSDSPSMEALVVGYCRAWTACQEAALETQRHESFYVRRHGQFFDLSSLNLLNKG